MKLPILRLLVFLLAAPLLLTSCGKDDDPIPLTNTDLLVASEWRGESVIANGMDVSEMQQIKDMLLDIRSTRLQLERDGTYTASYTQAGTMQSTTGSWSLKDSEKVVFFDLLGDLTIKDLNTTTMILTKEVEYLGQNVNAEVKFVPAN